MKNLTPSEFYTDKPETEYRNFNDIWNELSEKDQEVIEEEFTLSVSGHLRKVSEHISTCLNLGHYKIIKSDADFMATITLKGIDAICVIVNGNNDGFTCYVFNLKTSPEAIELFNSKRNAFLKATLQAEIEEKMNQLNNL